MTQSKPLVYSTANQLASITRDIEQAPNMNSMIRELVKNAIEAIQSTVFSPNSANRRKYILMTKVDPAWFALTGYSSSKFCIVNTGNGMTSIELMKHVDLNSSGSTKKQGIQDNFGIGAKVSTLGVNRRGVIWVSCQNGVVSMISMNKTTDKVTGVEYYGSSQVYDITPLFVKGADNSIKFGFDNTENWTAVILCGNDVDQDTTVNPYGTGVLSAKWASEEMERRFASIPEDITFRTMYHNKYNDGRLLPFQTITSTLSHLMNSDKNYDVKYEKVVDGDIIIHYYWDGKSTDSEAAKHGNRTLGSDRSTGRCHIFSAVQYKGEYYDVRGGGTNRNWATAAKHCGINYGAQHIRIYVELPENGNFMPDRYRTNLLIDDEGKTPVELTAYASQIYANIPAWLKDKMSAYKPKTQDLGDVERELQDVLNRLVAKQKASKLEATTNLSKNGVSGGGVGGYGADGTIQNAGNGQRRGSSDNGAGRARVGGVDTTLIADLAGAFTMDRQYPKIEVLNTAEDIANVSALCETFSYKAAEMISNPDGDTLYINGTYGAVAEIERVLLDSVDPKHASDSAIEKVARDTALATVTLSVGTGLAHGLAKRVPNGYVSGFSEDDFLKVTDPATLSTHADAWSHSIETTVSQFKKQVKPLITAMELAPTVDANMTEVFNLEKVAA